MATFVWSRNTARESSYISFFCGVDIFWSSATAGELTRGSLQVCFSHQRVSAFSPKLQTLYCLSNPMNRPIRPRIFFLWQVIGTYTRMLRAVLNKSWRLHPTRHQLYGHLPPITKTIQVRRTRHAGHCWRSKDELISDVLLWTPTYGCAKAGRPARTYREQLCEDTGCNPKELLEAMNDREKWWERVRDIRAGGTTWWWWWWWWWRHTSVFFSVICWSYLRTEISVILSTGNKLHFFSFLVNHFVDVILRQHWIC